MLQVVPRDVAVGFRAQSGDDQWLVYRSLGPAGNRAVLGQNISSEFYAGRFQRKMASWPSGSKSKPRAVDETERHVDCRQSCGGCESGSPERPRRRAAVPMKSRSSA